MNTIWTYTPEQIRLAGQHIIRLQAYAEHDAQKAPGIGWAPLFEMLAAGRASLMVQGDACEKLGPA